MTTVYEHASLAVFAKTYDAVTSAYTALAAELAAADGDLDKAVDAFLQTADDERSVALREKLAELEDAVEKVQAAFYDHAKANVQVTTLTPEQRAEKEKQLKKAAQDVKANITATSSLLPQLEFLGDTEARGIWEAYLAEHPDPTRKRAASGNAGGGLPKYPAIVTLTTDTGAESEFQTISKAVGPLGMTVREFYETLAKAAGVELADVAQLDREVTFTHQAKNGQAVFTVSVRPKPHAKPGRKPSAGPVAEAASGDAGAPENAPEQGSESSEG